MSDPFSTTQGQSKTVTQTSPPWKVIVLNDPVNLMAYVTMVFKRVFGYDQEKSQKHMLEVHELGKSILWTGDREHAEIYTQLLQQWQLNAILEQDDQD